MTKLKKLITCVLVASICMGLILTASAEEEGDIIPSYVGISKMAPKVEIPSNGQAMCSDVVMIRNGYTASVVWSLQRQSQKTWLQQTTWNGSGKGEITLKKYYYVTHGYNYRLVTSVTVYNSQGKQVETGTVVSASVYY